MDLKEEKVQFENVKVSHDFILKIDRLNPKDQMVDEDLICLVCFDITQVPVECESCQTIFCQDCLNQWQEKAGDPEVCPKDCIKIRLNKKPHKKFQQQLFKLTFRCENYDQGCRENVTFESVKIHQLKECLFMNKLLQMEEHKNVEKQQQNPLQLKKEMDIENPNKFTWFWRDYDQLKWIQYQPQLIEYIEAQLSKGVKLIPFLRRDNMYQIKSQNGISFIQTNTKTKFSRSCIRIELDLAYKGAFWLCNLGNQEQVLYSKLNIQLLEDRYSQYKIDKTLNSFELEVPPQKYSIHFDHFMQMNIDTKMKREIERISL